MEPRTIAIGLIAVIAAFAAAFGISSSGGGSKTATAGPGTKATMIKVTAPAAITAVPAAAGTVPGLASAPKVVHHKKKAAKNTSSTSSPSTSNSTQSTPSTQNSTPSTPTTPAPSAPVSKPAAPKPSKPSNPAPVSGGGESG